MASTGSGCHIPRMTVNTIARPTEDKSVQSVHQREFSHSAHIERDQRQIPKTSPDASGESYVLTLSTSPDLHGSMNTLRRVYFPKKLNRIDAHLTLFHALPESHLESEILPAIEKIVQKTAPYRIRAASAFKLSKGVGIKIDDDIDHANDSKQGRNMTRQIHAQLRNQWGSWLSEQDSSPIRLHYTVMNKVTDSKIVDEALSKVADSLAQQKDLSGGHFDHDQQKQQDSRRDQTFHPLQVEGTVRGLTLWRYNRGSWANPREFAFEQKHD